MNRHYHSNFLLRKVPCAALLCCIINAASAANEWIRCESELIKIYVTDEADLYIHPEFRRDYLRICNLERDHFSISPTACQAWLDMAQTALASNLDIRLMYSGEDADGKERECKTLPVYQNAPAPRYFMLIDD